MWVRAGAPGGIISEVAHVAQVAEHGKFAKRSGGIFWRSGGRYVRMVAGSLTAFGHRSQRFRAGPGQLEFHLTEERTEKREFIVGFNFWPERLTFRVALSTGSVQLAKTALTFQFVPSLLTAKFRRSVADWRKSWIGWAGNERRADKSAKWGSHQKTQFATEPLRNWSE
jgi:hypothetical protein